MQKRNGFTLIELLVVVSIIALLVSILLPTLEEARREAKVVACASNLHQIGIGFVTYASAFGDYPPVVMGSPRVLYYSSYPHDLRQTMVDIGSGISGIYWCPLDWGVKPEDSLAKTEWSDHYYLDDINPDIAFYYVGYSMPVLYLTQVHDFTYSGNPRGPKGDYSPRQVGDPSCVIVSDYNFSFYGVPLVPDTSAHCTAIFEPFVDSNSLFGDGHVIRTNELKYYVSRLPTPAGNFAY